jgi:hypothetical protein
MQDDRTQALDEIAAIAARHAITAEDIARRLGSSSAPAESAVSSRRQAVLVRVLAFIGGTFVFAGIGVFIALRWDTMTPGARVVVTLGSGIALFVLAILAGRDLRFEKASTPLLLVAAALEPTGMLVAFDEFGAGRDWHLAGIVTSVTMAGQFLATFTASRGSTPLFLTMSFAALFWWTTLDYLDVDGDVIAVVLGASMLAAALGINRTPHRDITPPWFFAGAAAFLGGLFALLESTPIDIAFIAAAAGFVYLSVLEHSRTLLFVAIVSILAYTAWFTSEHFAESIGWPLALIAFGIFMIGLSTLALRIDREYVRKANP